MHPWLRGVAGSLWRARWLLAASILVLWAILLFTNAHPTPVPPEDREEPGWLLVANASGSLAPGPWNGSAVVNATLRAWVEFHEDPSRTAFFEGRFDGVLDGRAGPPGDLRPLAERVPHEANATLLVEGWNLKGIYLGSWTGTMLEVPRPHVEWLMLACALALGLLLVERREMEPHDMLVFTAAAAGAVGALYAALVVWLLAATGTSLPSFFFPEPFWPTGAYRWWPLAAFLASSAVAWAGSHVASRNERLLDEHPSEEVRRFSRSFSRLVLRLTGACKVLLLVTLAVPIPGQDPIAVVEEARRVQQFSAMSTLVLFVTLAELALAMADRWLNLSKSPYETRIHAKLAAIEGRSAAHHRWLPNVAIVALGGILVVGTGLNYAGVRSTSLDRIMESLFGVMLLALGALAVSLFHFSFTQSVKEGIYTSVSLTKWVRRNNGQLLGGVAIIGVVSVALYAALQWVALAWPSIRIGAPALPSYPFAPIQWSDFRVFLLVIPVLLIVWVYAVAVPALHVRGLRWGLFLGINLVLGLLVSGAMRIGLVYAQGGSVTWGARDAWLVGGGAIALSLASAAIRARLKRWTARLVEVTRQCPNPACDREVHRDWVACPFCLTRLRPDASPVALTGPVSEEAGAHPSP